MAKSKFQAAVLFVLTLGLAVFVAVRRDTSRQINVGTRLLSSAEKKSPHSKLNIAPKVKGNQDFFCTFLFVDKETGKPVPFAKATIEPIGGRPVVVLKADKTGRLTVKPPVEKMVAEAEGYLPVRFEVKIACGSVLKLPLPAGQMPLVRVVDAQTGLPIPKAQVFAEGAGSEPPGVFHADKEGNVCIQPPPVCAKPNQLDRILNSTVLRLSVSCEGYYSEMLSLHFSKARSWPRIQLVRLEPLMEYVGRVLDPQGRGVPGAKVFWVWEIRRGLARRSGKGSAVAEGDGTFRWKCPLAAFEITFFADNEEFAPGVTHVVLGAWEPDTEVVVVLKPQCNLEGLVVDDDGVPVEGAHVYVRPLERPPQWEALGGVVVRSTGKSRYGAESDGQGRFVLEDLAPGKYEVFISHRVLIPLEVSERDIVLPFEGTWVVRMTRGESLHCVVFSEDEGEIPDAWLHVLIPDPRVPSRRRPLPSNHVLTEGPGAFTVIGLRSGTCYLRAGASGFRTVVKEAHAGVDEEIGIALVRKEKRPGGAFLTVSLRCNGAVPDLEFVPCWAIEAGSKRYSVAGLVKGGKARIGPLPPGRYTLVLSPMGFAPEKIPDVCVPTQNVLDVELEQARTVLGRIYTEPREQLRFFELLDEDGIPLKLVSVRPDGTFRIRGLRPGRYFAQSSAGADSGSWRSPDFFEVGDVGEVTITLKKAGAEHAEREQL